MLLYKDMLKKQSNMKAEYQYDFSPNLVKNGLEDLSNSEKSPIFCHVKFENWTVNIYNK